MSKIDNQNPEKKGTINQKIADLDKKVEWFYSDDFDLNEAVTHYREAIELSKSIEKDLNGLKNEIEIIDKNMLQ